MKSTLKKQQSIKNIKSQLVIAQTNRKDMMVRSAQLQRDVSKVDKHIERLESLVASYTNNSGAFVTEHAMVRYLERIMGADMVELKKTIMPDRIKAQIEKLGGTGSFPVGDFTVIVKNYAVTTVVDNK